MNIDRKYQINAVNPVSGRIHSENDSVLFLAKDAAFLSVLPQYLEKCKELGSNPDHLESISLLIDRVGEFQKTSSDVPDTLGAEINRCIDGDIGGDRIPGVAPFGSFSWALMRFWEGAKIARRGWNGKGIFVGIQRPDEKSKMTSPYAYIDTTGLHTINVEAPKSRVPWLPSQTDMLACDWEEIE